MKEQLADQTQPVSAEVIAAAQAYQDPEVTQQVTIPEQSAPEKVYPEPKATFIYDEEGRGKLVPKNEERQVEWVNGPQNQFDLDRKQLHALSPEARKAYLTAQSERLRPDDSIVSVEPAAPDFASRLSDRREKETADATLRAEAARAKAEEARGALNGASAPATDEISAPKPGTTVAPREAAPEPQQKPLAERITEADLDRLDMLAEGVTIHKNTEHFDKVADDLGVTQAERAALLDIASRTATVPASANDLVPIPRPKPVSGAQSPESGSAQPPKPDRRLDEVFTDFLKDPEAMPYSDKVALADRLMAEGHAANNANDDVTKDIIENRMDTLFESLTPEQQAAFEARYKLTPVPTSEAALNPAQVTPSDINFKESSGDMYGENEPATPPQPNPAEAASQPPEQAARPKGPTDQLYEKFEAGTLTETDKRVLAAGLMRQARGAHASGDNDTINETLPKLVQVYDALDDEGRAQFDAQYGALPRGPIPEAAPNPAPETEAERKFRLREAFFGGQEDTLTPTEKADLLMDLQEAGDNDSARELFSRLDDEALDELTRRQAARQGGNQQTAQPNTPAVHYDVDTFAEADKSDRYGVLNRIADYAHQLMDAKADPEVIDAVWEQFGELYDTLSKKERREFRNKVSNWEFDDVSPLERLTKNPIKTFRENRENRKNGGSEKGGGIMKKIETQRLEKGIDANGDWIGMPIRNRAEDELTTDARYLDVRNLRREAENLNRWAHPIKKFKLNAEASERARAYRVESMAPVALTEGQRRNIGLPQVYGQTDRALNDPNNAQWLSTATKRDLARRANALYQSENEFDPNQFTGPQYTGTARTLVPGSWRRNRRYIGQGRVTDLQQRLTSARREADYNYAVTAWNYRQQQARAQAGPQNYGGSRRP
jgi:hypothetical protein